MLVHETASGVQLAFATPRGWLAPGKRIAVRDAPTRFGAVSYDLEARNRAIEGNVEAPAHAKLELRLRLPAGERIASVRVNGRPATHRGETIDLGGRGGTLELVVGVTRRAS